MPWTKKAILLIAFYLRLPVVALSLGRNVYTLRLRHQTSDAGLDPAIVTIWLEVQLTYALAASTLSALKAFTESFNSGFGLGFARGKSENSSYALSSHMSRSNTETGGTSIASRSKPDRHNKGLDDDETGTIFPPANISKDKNNRFLSFTRTSPLKLRSDLVGPRSGATATATSEDARWNHDSDADVVHPGFRVRESDLDGNGEHVRAPEELVILRETELSIRRDLASDYLRYTKQ
jgi:hypothetical protein